MKSSKSKLAKDVVVLLTPLLLFAILFVPYNWANHQFIIDWLGCGCSTVDTLGNRISPDFNTNDFTALFWLFISVCATVISAFLSKRIPKEKIWLKILYVVGMLAVSLLITNQFYRMMVWD